MPDLEKSDSVYNSLPITESDALTESNHAVSWITRQELGILLAMLMIYAVISLSVWSSYDTYFDAAGYIDPAASYVMGQGFTSGCWYAQSHDEFWAGNVPLYQFLLIPWFKCFGISPMSAMALNLLCIDLAMGLLWLGMLRSRLVLTPGWRLGAVGFFLVSDSSFSLAMTGRPEPVCILIACAAWLSLTFEHRAARWGSLIACGLATPWAGLQLAVCLAFAGVGAILFYHTRYWREVLALAVGGILGAASLLFFYRHMGVLDAFLLNISPHTSASVLHSKLTGMEHVRQGAFRLGGFTSPSSAWAVLLSLGACLFAFLHKHHQRLAVLNLGFIAGLPLLLITLGVFPHYYGCYWLLPMTVILFALLSAGVMGTALRTTIMAVLLWVSVPMPGAYLWRTLVQGLPAALSDRHERLTLFLKNAVHSNDMAWVDCRIWFATKPLVKGLFSTNWLKQATFGKDRDEMTVVIAASDTSGGFAAYLECLPGKWQSTGEYLEVPNYYRFYRILNTPPPIHYEVFRRIDRS